MNSLRYLRTATLQNTSGRLFLKLFGKVVVTVFVSSEATPFKEALIEFLKFACSFNKSVGWSSKTKTRRDLIKRSFKECYKSFRALNRLIPLSA